MKKEPQRLREAREENLSQTQNLAFENYKTFIQTADCSRDVFSEFGNVESKLDSLLDELPSGLYKASRTLVDFLKKTLRVEWLPLILVDITSSQHYLFRKQSNRKWF